MKVRVKSQRAVLYVEGKRVDVKVAGADDSERFGIVHPPGVVQVQVRDLWSCIFIHTAKTMRYHKCIVANKYCVKARQLKNIKSLPHNSLMTMSGTQNLSLGREILLVPHWSWFQLTNSLFHHFSKNSNMNKR